MNLLSTKRGRRLLFGILYLSEGAPVGFLWWALPAMLRESGAAIGDITILTSTLALPWIFKFFWAPVIDVVRTSRWSLKSWILSTQFLMGCSLVPLLIWDVPGALSALFPCLILHSIAAATQDAAIDALAVSNVPREEQGSVTGWMQAGMLCGRSLLGGGSLMVMQSAGIKLVVLLLIALVWGSSLLLLLARERTPGRRDYPGIADRFHDVSRRLRSMAGDRVTWFALLFAALGGAGFEGVGSVAGPYMIDRGLAAGDVGSFFAINAVLGMAAGALIGGLIVDRLGKRLCAAVFLGLVTLCVLTVAGLDRLAAPESGKWLLPTFTALYVAIGLFTAASYALFMEITDPALGATQFSALMGATNGCESWAAFAVGRMIPGMGYSGAFLVMGCIPLLSLPLVRLLRRTPG